MTVIITVFRCFQKHEGAVQSVSFSPDSSWLITSCTLGVLKLFSTAELIDTCTPSNEDVAELVSIDDAHDMGVVSCDFSTFQEVTCTQTCPISYLNESKRMNYLKFVVLNNNK